MPRLDASAMTQPLGGSTHGDTIRYVAFYSPCLFVQTTTKGPTPSEKAPPWNAPSCPQTRPSPFWAICARASASAPPAGSPASPGTPSRATSPGPATRPNSSTTSWWLFPPLTCEVQFDEKWNFVGKKEKNSDPDDPRDDDKGDDWDHTAVDAEHRLLLAGVPRP